MAMKQKNLPAIVPELFEHEQFGQFRFIKRGEEIWFAAVDVCRILGLTNPTMAVSRLKENERASFKIGQSSINEDEYPKQNLGYSKRRGNPNLTFVNEPGLYRLIFTSNKPEAEKFQDWVYHEVLPSIRKYGFYGLLNGEQVRQLPIREYVHYLGQLTPEQYENYLRQLTTEQGQEHYNRLRENLPNMTQEEIKDLAKDPCIIVRRVGNGNWKAEFFC